MSVLLRKQYSSIKKEKLSEQAKSVLKSMYETTNGFKDAKATRKIKPKFEAFYNKLKESKPEAIVGAKAKSKAAPKKSADEFKAARERRKPQTGVPKDKKAVDKDASRPAISKRGKRTSKAGNTYYEYRDNRLDKNPSKYPMLEKGGYMAKGGSLSNEEYDKLTRQYDKLAALAEDAVGKEKEEYKRELEKVASQIHKEERGYAKGGETDKWDVRKLNDEYYPYGLYLNNQLVSGLQSNDEKLIDTKKKEIKERLSMSKGGNTEIYEVELSAESNPDYDKSSYEGSVNIKSHKVKAKSIENAIDIVMSFIMENDLGGGNWSGGNVYKNGKKIGHVSYNGRYWDDTKMAKGGGIYSSDSLYYLQVLKDGEEIGREKFRAKSLKEAREIAEDDYEKEYQSKFGDHLSFIVSEAMEEGAELSNGFSIDEMKEHLNDKFSDSFGFKVYPIKKGTTFTPDYDAEILKGRSLKGLSSSDLGYKKLMFPKYKKSHEINYEVTQGGENTYFEFLLSDIDGDKYYAGTFGFKDQGDVDSEYVTRFIAFLMESYGLPFRVEHSVYAKGGGIYSSDSLYYLQVLKNGEEVGREKFRAKSLKEAHEIAEDDFEDMYESKFGEELSFIVSEAMEKGGETHRLDSIFEDGGEIAEGNLEMAMSNVKAIEHHASELKSLLDENTSIEAWVVAKLERAETDLSDVTHYIDGLQSNMDTLIIVEQEYARGGYMENGGETMKEAYVQQVVEIATKANQNGIRASDLTYEEFSNKVFEATNTSYAKDYLRGAYEVMKNKGYARGGFVGKGELVWRKLNDSKKMEFLYENFTPQITPRSQEILVGKDFQFLPKDVKIKLEAKYANVEEYARGGEITPYIIWVSKDGEKREMFGEYKSKRAADMKMNKLWESGEYKTMGNKPKSMYEKEGFYGDGGYMADGGKIGGRGWANYEKGDRINKISELKVGQTYLQFSKQFNSKNIIKIISGDRTALNRDIVYAGFVRDENDKKPEGDFAIWGYELDENELYEIKKSKMAKGGRLSRKQKQLDLNKNGKLDSQDFKMLRAGRKNARKK